MIDPITAAAAATQAFAGVKYLVEQGKEAHQVMTQIATWYTSASDVLYHADRKQNKVPLLKKIVFSKSVESDALKAFAAQQSVKAQQKVILEIINLHYGGDGLAEFRQLKNKIKRERQELVYAQIELRDKVLSGLLVFFMICVVVGTTIFIVAASPNARAVDYSSYIYQYALYL